MGSSILAFQEKRLHRSLALRQQNFLQLVQKIFNPFGALCYAVLQSKSCMTTAAKQTSVLVSKNDDDFENGNISIQSFLICKIHLLSCGRMSGVL